MNNCETCKYWTQDKNDYFHTEDNKTGRCSKIPMISSEHFDEDEWSQIQFVNKGDEKAFASDSDGYAAWLYTRYDFGCVMYVDSASNAEGWE